MPDLVGTILEVVGALGGGSVIVGGLAWLLARKMLQRDRARFEHEMEGFRQRGAAAIEELRTSGTKDIFVHRMQFENEFNVYLQMTDLIVQFRRAFNKLSDVVLGPVSDQDAVMEELREINGKLNDLVYPRRPFYDAQVFKAVDAMLNTVARDVRRMARDEKRRDGDGVASDKAIEKVKGLMEVVFDRIRERVWSKEFMGYTHPHAGKDAPSA